MIDISGKHFGRLTAVKRAHRAKNGEYTWLCNCSCGGKTTVALNSLKKGLTKSCGCLQREEASILHKVLPHPKGSAHPSWRGGLTRLGTAIRNLLEYHQWRSAVFHRDGFTCQKCGNKGGCLHAHHKKHFQTIIDEYNITTVEQAIACEELWDIWNGTTLCKDCHKETHENLGEVN
jgi:hypothetical protein